MGIFWRTRSDEIKEEIQELIADLGRLLLRAQGSLVNNNGVTTFNISEIEDLCQRMTTVRNRVEALLNELSDTQVATLNVPWLDGRYSPLPIWIGSYNLCVTKIKNALIAYAESL